MSRVGYGMGASQELISDDEVTIPRLDPYYTTYHSAHSKRCMWVMMMKFPICIRRSTVFSVCDNDCQLIFVLYFSCASVFFQTGTFAVTGIMHSTRKRFGVVNAVL
jgi:hypothetical protein